MSKERKILTVIIVNIVIVLSEILFGLIANSYALIADALHNGGDVIAVIITYIAMILSVKSPTFKNTFGYIKAEMMASFVNSLFLFITMFIVIYEAINKLINPHIVEPFYMITIGLIALVANGISAYVLNSLGIEHSHGDTKCEHSNHAHEHHHHNHSHHDNEDTNIKSAYLHMLGDALISLGVVVGGIFIYAFKIYSIDSILALGFSIYILKQTYPLLKKSFLSLMDANIVEVEKDTLESIILADEKVVNYHDLHIYKPSSKHSFISLHVIYEDENLTLKHIQNINDKIYNNLKKLGFNHILIQSDLNEFVQNHHSCQIK